MKQIADTAGMTGLSGEVNPVHEVDGLQIPQRSLHPAVPGNLSAAKEESTDHESAALATAADCIWDYASIRTIDYALMPAAPSFRRYGSRRFRGFSGSSSD